MGFSKKTFGGAGSNADVIIFATESYAAAVEFGTPTSRAFPFLFPKFFQHLPEVIDAMAEGVVRAFEEGGDIARI